MDERQPTGSSEAGDWPRLVDPVLVAAFEGWNDAGDAASGAVEHLELVWDAQPLTELDPDDYYDFQVNRPTVSLVDGISRRDHLADDPVLLLPPAGCGVRPRPRCTASSRTCAGAASVPNCSPSSANSTSDGRDRPGRAAVGHRRTPGRPR